MNLFGKMPEDLAQVLAIMALGSPAIIAKRTFNVRDVFNSPFRPFVLTSTSIGQEGLDFHWYCKKIIHWNLPSNPVDLEQTEGRINRYKGLVIRNNLDRRYNPTKKENNIIDMWNSVFENS